MAVVLSVPRWQRCIHGADDAGMRVSLVDCRPSSDDHLSSKPYGSSPDGALFSYAAVGLGRRL